MLSLSITNPQTCGLNTARPRVTRREGGSVRQQAPAQGGGAPARVREGPRHRGAPAGLPRDRPHDAGGRGAQGRPGRHDRRQRAHPRQHPLLRE